MNDFISYIIQNYEQEQPYQLKNLLHLNYNSVSNIIQKHWWRSPFKENVLACLYDGCFLLFLAFFFLYILHLISSLYDHDLFFIQEKNITNVHNKTTHKLSIIFYLTATLFRTSHSQLFFKISVL